jgi:hypothetical protein
MTLNSLVPHFWTSAPPPSWRVMEHDRQIVQNSGFFLFICCKNNKRKHIDGVYFAMIFYIRTC